MNHHSTGRGRWERRTEPPSVLFYNFDIDGDFLKHEHRVGLLEGVVPTVKAGGSVSVVGLASRGGSARHNLHLSVRRAERTLAFLRDAVPRGLVAHAVVGVGEMKARAEGQRDGSEHPRFRSVILFVGAGPTPPTPPTTIDVSPADLLVDQLFPDDDMLDLASKITDVAIGTLGFTELVPLEVAAAVGGTLGGALSGLSAAVLMPLTWTGLHGQNIANGRIEGYADAVQSMADAFGSPALRSIPESRWPALPHPTPRLFSAAELTLVNQREWMAGRREGCALAYEFFNKLEGVPLRGKSAVVNGRQLLAWMRGRFGSEGVKPWLMAAINHRLIGGGNGTWPLRRF
jgi:hypothetical protein